MLRRFRVLFWVHFRDIFGSFGLILSNALDGLYLQFRYNYFTIFTEMAILRCFCVGLHLHLFYNLGTIGMVLYG